MERKRNMERREMKAVMGVAAGLIVIGAFFGGYFIGKNVAGRQNEERVEKIAGAVKKKAEYVAKLEKLYGDGWGADSETIDKTGIEEYVARLQTLIDETEEEGIREVLNDYMGKWRELAEVYEERDNEAIMQAFEGVKMGADESARRIRGILDGWIERSYEG